MPIRKKIVCVICGEDNLKLMNKKSHSPSGYDSYCRSCRYFILKIYRKSPKGKAVQDLSRKKPEYRKKAAEHYNRYYHALTPDPEQQRIGQILRQRRQALGVTLKDLGKVVRMGSNTLSMRERGLTPWRYGELEQVLAVLGLQTADVAA